MPPQKKSKQHGDVDFNHLVTDRLKLRRMDISDLVALTRYRSKPEVARFQGWSDYSGDDAMKLIREMKTRHPGILGYWFQFAVELQPRGSVKRAMIGDCGLRVNSADPTQAEIGYTLDSTYHGQGYGTEVVTALLHYCFSVLGLRRVTATTDVLNAASAKLLAKVGMRKEAHWIENTRFKGEWGSEFQYAILSREWPPKKRRSKKS